MNATDHRDVPTTALRVFTAGALLALATLVGFSVGARAKGIGADIVRLDRGATPTEHGQYPREMVVNPDAFDGSYTSAVGYRSEDRKFTVGLWQSEAGILRTDGYPHDEYCLVLEGRLVVTNASGWREEFGPGDAFVIPKGWTGTWNMTSRFKKQYVAFEEGPRSAARASSRQRARPRATGASAPASRGSGRSRAGRSTS